MTVSGLLVVVGLMAFPCIAQAQAVQRLPRMDVVIIIDQSNRIDRKLHPGQVDRDTAIIRMIANEFAGVVRRNRYLFSRDRLRVVYTGENTPPTEPRVDVAQMNAERQVVVKNLPDEIKQFVEEASRPYFTPKSNMGADIWGWFKNTAPVMLQATDTSRANQTRIIILTDGYLEFARSISRQPGTAMRMDRLRGRKDWQTIYPSVRLAPVGHKLTDARVLMLELAPIRPEVNTTEQQIIERYWSDWFQEMGVDSRFLSNSVGLPTVQDIIRQFFAR